MGLAQKVRFSMTDFVIKKLPYDEWHLLWLPVVTMPLDFSASMGTRNL